MHVHKLFVVVMFRYLLLHLSFHKMLLEHTQRYLVYTAFVFKNLIQNVIYTLENNIRCRMYIMYVCMYVCTYVRMYVLYAATV
jgi:hypothetical protein